jgi:hypothetical protein
VAARALDVRGVHCVAMTGCSISVVTELSCPVLSISSAVRSVACSGVMVRSVRWSGTVSTVTEAATGLLYQPRIMMMMMMMMSVEQSVQ